MNWNCDLLVQRDVGRIIVIDGDPAIRDSLATLLALDNLPTQIYATGGDFLLTLDEAPIACIAVETDLPDGSGYAVLARVRERYPAAKLALLISRKDRNVVARAEASGVTEIFFKPLIQQSLIDFLTHSTPVTAPHKHGHRQEPL